MNRRGFYARKEFTMVWVYIQSEPGLYTVGFYDPRGEWHADTDWRTKEEAANRVAWLNGSKG